MPLTLSKSEVAWDAGVLIRRRRKGPYIRLAACGEPARLGIPRHQAVGHRLVVLHRLRERATPWQMAYVLAFARFLMLFAIATMAPGPCFLFKASIQVLLPALWLTLFSLRMILDAKDKSDLASWARYLEPIVRPWVRLLASQQAKVTGAACLGAVSTLSRYYIVDNE